MSTHTQSTQPAAEAIIVFEDGRTFRGRPFGAAGETFGEAVFTTGMTGYQETLTDPSYHRQVVVATAPHVGNTGWNDEDDESQQIWAAGFVVRDPARVASNWRSRRTLDEALARQGIVGISGVDTRAITRHLRDAGAMRVGISTLDLDPESLRRKVLAQPSMSGANLVADVTCPAARVLAPDGPARFRIAAIDLGIKAMTPQRMTQRGLEVHVLPADTDAAALRRLDPDGVFFSNGPGDPATAATQIALLREALATGLPCFGICFGHQLFARALGFDTYKLRYGHRGINQPVQELASGRVAITAHNHGFAVVDPGPQPVDTPYGRARVSHRCLNDGVVEGLELRGNDGRLRAFSVQYHPEAAAGPHDAADLFDRFVALLAKENV